MKIQRLALICCVFLSCCICQKKEYITDFPIRPELMFYPTPPVIEKIDQNFLVTPELIYNATMLRDYYKRIDLWKEKRNIK